LHAFQKLFQVGHEADGDSAEQAQPATDAAANQPGDRGPTGQA
jgi:hypothetical protein